MNKDDSRNKSKLQNIIEGENYSNYVSGKKWGEISLSGVVHFPTGLEQKMQSVLNHTLDVSYEKQYMYQSAERHHIRDKRDNAPDHHRNGLPATEYLLSFQRDGVLSNQGPRTRAPSGKRYLAMSLIHFHIDSVKILRGRIQVGA